MNDDLHKPNAGRSRQSVVHAPEFFLIGAPKSGTTSLYSYLSAHPRIFMPRMKEPFYFCSDLPGYCQRSTLIRDRQEYLALFSGATDQHAVCGEASSLYLYSKVAVPAILAFHPHARFIVMLRNPVDLVYAFHAQLVRGLEEPVGDFECAWRLQGERACGHHVPKTCFEPAVLQYRQVGCLGTQMERLFRHVSREQVAVYLLEDLASNPRQVYESVLAFLGLPSDGRSEFSKENAHQTHRSAVLARWIRTPPFPLDKLRTAYRRYVGIGTWPARWLARLNSRSATRPPLSAQLRCELEREFHDEVRLLERVIDRDLSHWIPSRKARPAPLRSAG